MHCPYCSHIETKVVDSRLAGAGSQIRRRRQCMECSERFTTFESAELVMPHIIKSNNIRQPFDEVKLRRGLTRALEKRPVTSDQIEAVVGRITKELLASGERDIAAEKIGLLVMRELKALDQVAYVRFASVYRSFQDVDEFREEIERLKEESHLDLKEQQMSLLKTGQVKSSKGKSGKIKSGKTKP